jgi:5-methylcytosine-specific restriction protein A
MNKRRSKIFQDLKVYTANPVWAWCAKNESLGISVFNIWEDKEENGMWLLYDGDNNILNKRFGAKNQKQVLDLSLDNSFTVYGLIAEAVNPSVSPRAIRRVNDKELVKLKLVRKGKKILGKKIGVVSVQDIINKNNLVLKNHGLLDFNSSNLDTDVPDRATSVVNYFKRNQKVRKEVLKRAKGKCEFCKIDGFELPNGKLFLETHHIIFLAKEGADRTSNVIALCPNHHRESHFGKNAENLEKEFERIIEDKSKS